MKKFLAVFSLLMLVLLTGCLSDKTERDLNATPTTAGETNYKYLTVKPDDSKLVKVTGKYYSLKNCNCSGIPLGCHIFFIFPLFLFYIF